MDTPTLLNCVTGDHLLEAPTCRTAKATAAVEKASVVVLQQVINLADVLWVVRAGSVRAGREEARG